MLTIYYEDITMQTVTSSQQFQGQNIFISGGSSGIGLAAAKNFLERGAKRVYISGRDLGKLQRAQAELGERVVSIHADLTKMEDIQATATMMQQQGESLDVLFANAGIAENNTLGVTSEAQFDATFDTNVKGLFFTVQSLLPMMKNEGSIILNASVAANKGMPNLSLYSASKAAVRSFARTWCNELKDKKIRVNTISPGVTSTPILKNGLKMTEESLQGFKQYLTEAVPLGRMAQAEEIANVVCFLAASDARYINGIELCVDGGFTQI
jgi:NAD(P)-dependent dehydrogenase (short-subunit alcohol dehydrogenase family)